MWEPVQSVELMKPRPVLIFRGVHLGHLHPPLQSIRNSIKFRMHFLARLAPGSIEIK